MSPYKITLVAKQQYPNGTIGTDEINLTTENIDVDLTAQTMDTALSIDKEIIPKGIRFSGVTSSNVSYDTKIYDDGEGKLGILSKGIVINNCELIQGTVIWDIGDQSRATITKVPMNIPKIASGMPCGACVGDYEATPEMYVAGCSVDPTNEYMYIFTGYYGSANYTRARFNYWCWVTVD
jgi:hypothetical protein